MFCELVGCWGEILNEKPLLSDTVLLYLQCTFWVLYLCNFSGIFFNCSCNEMTSGICLKMFKHKKVADRGNNIRKMLVAVVKSGWWIFWPLLYYSINFWVCVTFSYKNVFPHELFILNYYSGNKLRINTWFVSFIHHFSGYCFVP